MNRTNKPIVFVVVALGITFGPSGTVGGQSANDYLQREEKANSAPERAAFRASLEGRTVVVKQPLYTLIDTDPSNPNIRYGGPGTTYQARGLMVVSPSLGLFCRDVFGSRVVTDRDPERLLAKVGASRYLTMTTYKPETPMRIRSKRGVIFSPDNAERIAVILVDPLDGGGRAEVSTQITIEWSEPFSATFTERVEVERLLGTVIQLPASVVGK